MFIVPLVIVGLLILFIWFIYNDLVTVKMRVKEAWSQIDVQLNRRADLIPNLVKTIKSYAKHEKEVFENVTKARSALVSATTPAAKAAAEGQFEKVLKTLFAVAENYPELKASDNYIQLQKELSDTEDKVAFARQFYNQAVMDYNTKLQLFPQTVVANMMSLKPAEFFKAGEKDRQKIEVIFDK